MKCNSCQVEIDPKWKHAIEQNSCPFCGQEILNEQLKDLLTEARLVIDELFLNHKEELLDWMRSNYGFIHKDGANQMKTNETNKNESVFFKRAGVKETKKPEKTSMKDIVSKINNAGSSAFENASVDVSLEGEDLEPATDLEIQKAQDLINATYGINTDGEDEIPDVVANLANMARQPDYKPKDVAKLQNLLNKTKESRENVLNGVKSKGSFVRAG